jgi:hypothetical protein
MFLCCRVREMCQSCQTWLALIKNFHSLFFSHKHCQKWYMNYWHIYSNLLYHNLMFLYVLINSRVHEIAYGFGGQRRIPLCFDDFHFCRSRVIGLDITENGMFTLCRITWVVFLRMFWNFISSLPVKRGGSLSFLKRF